MADYLLRLAQGTPNGTVWAAAVTLRTSTLRTLVAVRILAVDPQMGNVPGVRVHVNNFNLIPGESVIGIVSGGAAAAGLGGPAAFWPVLQTTLL